jgi:hypothetical protein
MNRWIFVLLLTFCFFGCGFLAPEPAPDKTSIANPQERWKAYAIHDYTITQSLNCFCFNGGVDVKVEVRNDSVIRVRNAMTDSVFSKETFQRYKSVNDLFTFMGTIDTTKVAQYIFEYDSTYGFPKNIYVDYNAQIADEEMGYTTKNLVKF